MIEKCCICNRVLGDINISKHHLIPKCKKGKETITIHNICHAKIHHTFCENQLRDYYHTVDRLINHSEIEKFIKWVANKDPSYYVRNKDTKDRNKKR